MRPVHLYGGAEHSQPGPFPDCLLCRLEELAAAARAYLDAEAPGGGWPSEIDAAEARLREALDSVGGTADRDSGRAPRSAFRRSSRLEINDRFGQLFW